jgi:transcriptional regulator with XRE-family HTH domain
MNLSNSTDFMKKLRGTRSQTLIANEAGISQQMYSRIETGKCTPSPKVAKKLGSILGFDWTDFYKEYSTTA